jgi:hypothetical protein
LKSQVKAYLAIAGTSGHDVSPASRAIRVPERSCFPSAAEAFLPTRSAIACWRSADVCGEERAKPFAPIGRTEQDQAGVLDKRHSYEKNSSTAYRSVW